MKPMRAIVIGSRSRRHRSAPSVGTFSSPAMSFGSGNDPAGAVISRDASASARCAATCGERSSARRSAAASVIGTPDCPNAPAAAQARTGSTAQAACARRNRRSAVRAARDESSLRCMKPPDVGKRRRRERAGPRTSAEAQSWRRQYSERMGGGAPFASGAGADLPSEGAAIVGIASTGSGGGAQAGTPSGATDASWQCTSHRFGLSSVSPLLAAKCSGHGDSACAATVAATAGPAQAYAAAADWAATKASAAARATRRRRVRPAITGPLCAPGPRPPADGMRAR